MIAKDAVQLIQDTAVKANGQQIFRTDAEPNHVYLVYGDDGILEKRYADSGPLDHEAGDFMTVVKLAVDAAEEAAALWCSQSNGVIATFDGDMRDRAALTLTNSKPFAKLREFDAAGHGGAALDHITTFTLFRTLFRDCLPSHSSLRDDIKKVDIKKAQEAASGVSRTAVSMSKSLIAEASGADKLPEVLTFDVPVFAEAVAPVRATIRVAFDLDPQQERFRFIVLPGEIEKAIEKAEAWLEKQVADSLLAIESSTPIPVYRGVP